jgi:diguanylate cyclase (GGDEF)-like protein/PAS domain S-box-containing protein
MTQMETRIQGISIGKKLLFISVLNSAFVLFLVAVALLTSDTIAYKRSFVGELQTLARITAESSASAVTFEDHKAAEQILASLETVPYVQAAQILGRDGKTFASFVPSTKASGSALPIHSKNLRPSHHFSLHFVDLYEKIVLDGKPIGFLFVRADLGSLYQRLSIHVLTVLAILIVALSIALAVISRLQRIITGPIQHLAGSMRRVSEEKDYSIRADINSPDEFGALGAGFNEMLGQIQKRDEELEETQRHLEELVTRRTDSLASAKARLEEELAQRSLTEQALRESEERYALAAQGANDGLWDWNLLTDEIYFSPRWKSMLGYSRGEVDNKPEGWFSLIHEDDIQRLRMDMEAHFRGVMGHLENEHRVRHSDGSYRWMLTRGIAVRDEAGNPYRMAGSLTDITERKRAEQQLLYDAFHDGLTGLSNRTLFLDRLESALKRKRRIHDSLFAVIYLDLDRFKIINDSLGHNAGDKVLIETARRLEANLRHGDTVARWGGDEFVILAEDLEDLRQAEMIIGRIQKQLMVPFKMGDQEVIVTSSAGITTSDLAEYEKPAEMLRDADAAMYKAKNQGRDQYAIFSPAMHREALAVLQLEADLRKALEMDEFRLHYQPIISLEDGRVYAVEALVRWQHRDRGLVPPADFIPLAEETGLIVQLGQWIVENVCLQVDRWRQQGLRPFKVAINVSARQFWQPDFVEMVARSLKRSRVEPAWFDLEITEGVIVQNTEMAIDMLSQLKNIGLNLSLDDFGTGYSSLNYLHKFPIDILKIDRSFVNLIGGNSDENDAEIVQAIITLAHNMNIRVVAEGVERFDQLFMLQQMGCEYAQGFFFSRPIDAEHLLDFVREHQTLPRMPAHHKWNKADDETVPADSHV